MIRYLLSFCLALSFCSCFAEDLQSELRDAVAEYNRITMSLENGGQWEDTSPSLTKIIAVRDMMVKQGMVRHHQWNVIGANMQDKRVQKLQFLTNAYVGNYQMHIASKTLGGPVVIESWMTGKEESNFMTVIKLCEVKVEDSP